MHIQVTKLYDFYVVSANAMRIKSSYEDVVKQTNISVWDKN